MLREIGLDFQDAQVGVSPGLEVDVASVGAFLKEFDFP